MMLIELAREGFVNLTGVDYSDKAIELSQNIAKDQEIAITYKVADLLDAECCVALGRFDIVHDKGKLVSIKKSENVHPPTNLFYRNLRCRQSSPRRSENETRDLHCECSQYAGRRWSINNYIVQLDGD